MFKYSKDPTAVTFFAILFLSKITLSPSIERFCRHFFTMIFMVIGLSSNVFAASLPREKIGINSLMMATTNSDIDGVKFYSKTLKSSINEQNIGGATALHIASRNGNFEIVKILLQNQANPNILDNEGFTPLMRASLSAEPRIVDILLAKNSNAILMNSQNESALIHATSSDCVKCLALILGDNNFAKMDLQLLKQQLAKSFDIATKHDNQDIQNILQSYLDEMTKEIIKARKEEEMLKGKDLPMIEVIKSDKKVTKKYIFVPLKKSIITNPKVKIEEEPRKIFVIESAQEKNSVIPIEKESNDNSVKYKFVSDKDSKENPKQKINNSVENSVIYKFKPGPKKLIKKEN